MTDSKVILITGCSSGMGLEAAVALAKRGHQVYATMRDLNKRQKLEERLAQERTSAEVLRLDVTKDGTVDDCVGYIGRKEGKLDVLINNAGISLFGPLESVTIQEIVNLFDTNFLGTVRCIQAVLPIMQKQKSGLIITVTGILGLFGISHLPVYASSKFALEGLSESLYEGLGKFNIKVKIIEPWVVATGLPLNTKPGTRVCSQDAPSPDIAGGQEFKPPEAEQSAREAAMTYVAAVEDKTDKFRFQSGEKAVLYAKRKLVNPLTYIPLPP